MSQPTARAWLGSALGTRVARRMLLAFLLLGILPAAITLGVGQHQAREALRARHYAALGESIESLTQVMMERLAAYDGMAASRIERQDLAGLLTDPASPFDRVARLPAAGAPAWALPGQSGEPPAALASQDRPRPGRGRLVVLNAAGAEPAEIWLLRADAAVADAAALALRLSRSVLWAGTDLQAANAAFCALDARTQPMHCERPLPRSVLDQLAGRPADQLLGRVDWTGEEDQSSVFGEVFLKSRFDTESWLLVLTQPVRIARSAENRLNQAVLPAALLALMSALLLALVAVRRTLGPLQSLTQATERLAERDFAHRVALSGDNEFTRLGHSFNRMAEGLAQQFDTLGALARIDQLILEGRPVREIAGIARDLMVRGMPGAAVMVAVAEEDGWWLCRGDGRQRQAWLAAAPETEWLAQCAAGGSRVMTSDEPPGAQPLRPAPDLPAQLEPVIANGLMAGALLAARAATAPVTPAEQALITGLAGRLAVGLESARRAALLEVRANIDSLTGLPNRPNFLEQLGQRLSQAREESRRETVLFVDLDGFSHINDSLGHAAGDRMLGEVGRRLRETLGERGVVARLGGDEFALALSAVDDDAARAQAEQLVATLARPFDLAGANRYINACIGIASYPDQGNDPAELLRHADMAMYRAKARGQGSVAIYLADMEAEAVHRAAMDTEMRRALANGEFLLHYEPLVQARSGVVQGCEALIRWQHPERGMVPPGRFIPLAEETGLISPIGSWVLREACRQFMQWRRDGVPVSVVSVNVSVHQFQRPDFVDEVREVLAQTGMPASGLKLEITESLLMDEPREVEQRLNALAAMGLSLALDDFGTGYSSLTYLKRLPVDSIKLDRSFLTDLLESQEARDLARSAIGMLHALRKEVVAEGVEKPEHRVLLAGWGADLLQGWVFSKSMSGSAFADYVLSNPIAPLGPAGATRAGARLPVSQSA